MFVPSAILTKGVLRPVLDRVWSVQQYIGTARGGSTVGAGGAQAPPTPTNSMESRGKKEGEEEERKEGGRRREMSPPKEQILDPPLGTAIGAPTCA